MQRSSRHAKVSFYAALLSVCACDPDPAPPAEATQNLAVECLPSGVAAPAAAWTCSAPLLLECGSEPPPLYVSDATDPACTDPQLSAESADLRTPGRHQVRVTTGDGELACTTSVTVVDNQPPTLSAKTIALWPPNHKFHTIDVSDCVDVADACDAELQAEFIWASSDEPVDDLGDGHHAPDIMVDDCRRVQLRAERQGPKDGRVYKLGVRVVDRAGHATEAACTIVVDHDQRGAEGQDSGENYRIALDGQNGLAACDGTAPPAPSDAGSPAPDAGTPAADGGTPEQDAGTPQPPAMFVM